MSTLESGINPATSDASGTAEPSTVVTDPSSVGTSSAQPSTADTASVDAVQEDQTPTTQPDDPLAGVPSADELKALIEQNVPHAKSVAQLREALEKRNSSYSELESKYSVFQPVAEKFSAPEELQQLVDMRESLLGWERAEDGRLIPSTQKFLDQVDPNRQEFLFADLADAMITDPTTGQQIPRMHRALQYIASNPEERANAARILGLVEPSAVAPQWQATEEQLDAIAVDPANPTPQDKELQDIFRSLPYDEREQLSTNEPEFIRRQLGREKLTRQLEAAQQQTVARDQQSQQEREQMVQTEAARAGDNHVRTQLSEALTTFHKSVVDQCRLIEPLDPQNPPEGMDASQIAQLNQQIDQSNKAEAAQVTLAVIGLINEETRPFVLPLLKEIGVVDDKFLQQLDAAGKAFGDNARNYGHLTYAQKLGKNGNYQPGADVTMLNTESSRNLKLLAYYANQISKKLLEAKSQTFSMKATGHNSLLNGVAPVRPNANGSRFDPTTATVQQPSGWLSRDEIARSIG